MSIPVPDNMAPMHGLSPKTDLTPLNGSTLTYVGFGQYSLNLGFSGDAECSITIEADYMVGSGGQEPVTYHGAVAGAQALLPILGHTVASATVPADGTVRLIFDDESVVAVVDSSSNYESYQLDLGGRLLVV